jgi:hypothetical protein
MSQSPSGSSPAPEEDLARVLESARRLGVEMDEAEALQWLSAMVGDQSDAGIVTDERTGVFGHKVSMLDFSTADLEHFRRLGRLVEFHDVPGVVETALALSGSAAQSKFQTYPGDADFFERVNIIADSRAAACDILADLIRQKVADTGRGDTYLLIAVRFGSYPVDVVRDGKAQDKGGSMEWSPAEVAAGQFDVTLPDGTPMVIHWEDGKVEPGWCKVDWVSADPVRGQLVNASNMLDVTWEAPDGSITPLDGYLDPYFQEIYLEAESVPIFSKLAQHVSADALDQYVAQLEHEVEKYVTTDVNYGKAAKRMYNVFRLTGRYDDAVFVRELFDEPASLLYQVWSLFRTMEECCSPGSTIPIESVRAEVDRLVLSVVEVLEGGEESVVVRHLMRLRDALDTQESGQSMHADVEAARAEVINLVNNFFHEKLTAVPSINGYIVEFQARDSS